VVLSESMQQVDASIPTGVTPEHAAAKTHRWNARHIGAVRECRTDHIPLALDTPGSAPERRYVVLELEFGTAEDCVTLGVTSLLQLMVGVGEAACVVAGVACETPEDEAVEACVVGRQLESERGGGPPDSRFDRLCHLD